MSLECLLSARHHSRSQGMEEHKDGPCLKAHPISQTESSNPKQGRSHVTWNTVNTSLFGFFMSSVYKHHPVRINVITLVRLVASESFQRKKQRCGWVPQVPRRWAAGLGSESGDLLHSAMRVCLCFLLLQILSIVSLPPFSLPMLLRPQGLHGSFCPPVLRFLGSFFFIQELLSSLV